MCGIFGLLLGKDSGCSPALSKGIIDHLFVLSSSRGKEATGLAIRSEDSLNIYKSPVSAYNFIRTERYKELLKELVINKPVSIIGHTRLATSGSEIDNNNNSPIESGEVVGVHNGIVVNDNDLWARFSLIQRRREVDSEVIFSLLGFFYKNGLSLVESVKTVFKNIEGSASIGAFIFNCDSFALATNTGSLYSCKNLAANIHIFASELPILQILIKRQKLQRIIDQYSISQLKAGQGVLINTYKLTEKNFNLD